MSTAQREPFVLSGPALALFLLIFGVIWLGIHWVTSLAAPMDNVEQLVWIRSLELGYYKHPPLPTWIVGAAAAMVGPSIELTYVLGCIVTLAGLLVFWRLLCTMRGKRYATVALLATLCITFYCGRLYYYNHNVVMMLWVSIAVALTWHLTLKPSLATWALLGIVSGLGMLSKYQYVLAIAVIGLWWLRIGAWRNPVHVKGALLATVMGLLTLAPHLYWLTTHDWMPMHYADQTSLGLQLDGLARMKKSGLFAIDWSLNRGLPAWIVLAVALWWGRRRIDQSAAIVEPAQVRTPKDKMLREFWLLWGVAPLLFILAIGLLMGSALQLQWGTAFIFLCVPAVMELSKFPERWGSAAGIRAAWVTFAALQALILLQFWLGSPKGISGFKSSHQNHIPMAQIVEGIVPAAHKALGGPVDIIIGPQALAGRISLAMPEHPRVFVERNLQYSPWIHKEELANARIIEVFEGVEPLPEGAMQAYKRWSWRPVKISEGEF